MSRPATIVDVARVAGVSRQTVTRAVNDMPGISPATRERVLAAARELHYHPSRFGRGLVKPAGRTLGLLVADLTNPYYPELAATVLRMAGGAGWNVVLAEPSASDAADFAAGVDAVVSFTGHEFVGPAAGAPNLPVVDVDAPVPTAGHGHVTLDMAPAVEDAVAHLTARGVVRPVVLDRPGRAVPSARAERFTAAFARRGTTATIVATDVPAPWTATSPEADAVIAFNDLVAFGVLRELRLAGVDVPGRVRVLGVDGLRVGRYVTPRLSTLALDMTEVARTALDLVLGIADGRTVPGTPEASRRVEHRFVAAETT